nr:MAG TPA: ubiquitin-binding zinc finger protein [Bacteriophage sp.]
MKKKTKSNKYTIYCPQCHRRVAEWDGKYSSNVIYEEKDKIK